MPTKVVHASHGTIVLVAVCLSGHGPYPFVVDSGATGSAVDASLARSLRLAPAGRKETGSGVSCSASFQPVSVPSWSIDGISLEPQKLDAASIPTFGRGAPRGLLGSDVLSRFGAVRIDYRADTITVAGPEGPPPTSGVGLTPPASGPPSSLSHTGASVPMLVAHVHGQALAVVPLTFGTVTTAFILDTGSERSAVAGNEAARLGLRGIKGSVEVSGAACTSSARLVRSGKWTLGTPTKGAEVSLPSQALLALNLDGMPGVTGLLGSDILNNFGAVVIDYGAGRLGT